MKRHALIAAALFAAACQKPVPVETLQGYGEADYVYLASQEAGVVSDLFVTEGDKVEPGQAVFRLKPDRLGYNVQSATAQTGALQQAIDAASAQAELAQTNYNRTAELYQRGYATKAKLDADRAARDAARADLDRARRELAGANAQTGLAQTRLKDLDVSAPAAGTIQQVFHRPGEVVNPGEPVASLLPPANMKVRFFVPEARLSEVHLGQAITVTCDGCPGPLSAKVSFIADQPQFTPPVIYSLDERDKLVFLVEARLDNPDGVHPGQPLDISLK